METSIKIDDLGVPLFLETPLALDQPGKLGMFPHHWDMLG